MPDALDAELVSDAAVEAAAALHNDNVPWLRAAITAALSVLVAEGKVVPADRLRQVGTWHIDGQRCYHAGIEFCANPGGKHVPVYVVADDALVVAASDTGGHAHSDTIPVSRELADELLAAIEEGSDLSRCPYYRRGQPDADPDGICDSGCTTEPECQTCRPREGWPSERLASLVAETTQ